MRDGSTSVGLLRETTLGFVVELGREILANKFLFMWRLLSVWKPIEKCELVLWKEHQDSLQSEAGELCG